MDFEYSRWLELNPLPASSVMQPIFEAVENAFNAIEEAEPPSPLLTVTCSRAGERSAAMYDGDVPLDDSPITQIEVSDNGVGLDPVNWDAFTTVYSRHREEQGGKGAGRLSYLLAFSDVEFCSMYYDGTELRSRSGIIDANGPKELGSKLRREEPGTTVVMKGLREERGYRKAFPTRLETFANRLCCHFFSRLQAAPNGTRVMLVDPANRATLDVREHFAESFLIDRDFETTSVGGFDFKIVHARCHTTPGRDHRIHFCANERVVESKRLPKSATGNRGKLSVGESEFYYAAFVHAPLLDASVNPLRTSLTLQRSASDLNFGEPSIEEICDRVEEATRRYLHDVLEPLAIEHWQRLAALCKKRATFRPLLKHRENELRSIEIGLDDDELERRVAGVYSQWKTAAKERLRVLVPSARKNIESLQVFKDEQRLAIEAIDELTSAEFAEYLIDRKSIIDYLWQSIAVEADGRFRREDVIHDLFFPRKASLSDVPIDESNLWLIDERLLFQEYVASDQPWKKVEPLETESSTRSDLVAFECAHAFAKGGSPYSSVTIVEFKRPGRTNYTIDENPIRQTTRYIQEIRLGQALTDDGHVLQVQDSTQIIVWVVCHLVEEMKPFLAEVSPTRLPDGQGAVWQLRDLNAFCQAVTFEKLVADAKNRHRMFFDKLGIDETA